MDIIDTIIQTEKTRENVRKAIPVFIHWAQTGQTNHTYSDLIIALGKNRFSGVGHVLGMVQDVVEALAKKLETKIPTLNSLIKDKNTGLPAAGFSYVEPSYNTWSDEGKRIFVKGLDEEAINYPHWNMILDELGLSPLLSFSPEEIDKIKNPQRCGFGGESPEHKALKDYVKSHPSCLGVTEIINADVEHILPSGDRLDVYFECIDGSRVAVEVKPSISDDSDITRGIFQCIKYKAILEALTKADGTNAPVKAILVVRRDFSDLHQRLINLLGVDVQIIELNTEEI